jgi:hypothetical protein
MKWSRLKHLVEERLAPSVSGQISLHQARYRRTLEEVGRVWVSVNGHEVISFNTNSYVAKRASLGAELRAANDLRPYGDAGQHPEYLAADAQAEAILRRSGEYDDYHALADLERSLSMSIDEMLSDESPLLRALAVLDARVGKRRLRALLAAADEHAFVRLAVTLRCEAERVGIIAPAV